MECKDCVTTLKILDKWYKSYFFRELHWFKIWSCYPKERNADFELPSISEYPLNGSKENLDSIK